MAKRDKTAEAWEAISELKAETDAARLAEALRTHLSNRAGVVVAKAAALVLDRQSTLESHIARIEPALVDAFNRFMIDPAKSDPGCGAKIGIVNIGVAFHCLDAELYLRAIQHVQIEGSYGPPVDTAEALRAAAAYGLLNCRHADAMYEIVELLSEGTRDRFPDSRRGAIRALGTVVSETSAALLRMTARRYSNEPDTLGEVFASLNAIEANRSFEFLVGFLQSGDENVQDIAALAIAEGKQPKACDVLIAHARSSVSDDPRAVYTALAITRKPAAIEYLLDRVANAREIDAVVAIEALALMRHDDATIHRLRSIVKGRGGRAITEALSDLD